MNKLAFFDAKPYDIASFDKANSLREEKYDITYFEAKLTADTARLAEGFEAICAFVNDDISAETIEILYKCGVRFIAMRSAGYNNIDIRAAYKKIYAARVPAYSPYAIAEHAVALLLALNRKVHKAYIRTRDFNFSLHGLTGVDLHGKTVGVIGTGRIGRAFVDICHGFGMNVVAFDSFPVADSDIKYVTLDELFEKSDVISLHCPLTEQTKHMISDDAFSKMKNGVFLINTSRGALIDAQALLRALNSGKVRGAGLDVYEEEADVFFEDYSSTAIKDDVLSLLLTKPNVILTSHQAFLTEEALANIADTTLKNIDEYFSGGFISNEICYLCDRNKVKNGCRKTRKERCF